MSALQPSIPEPTILRVEPEPGPDAVPEAVLLERAVTGEEATAARALAQSTRGFRRLSGDDHG